MPAKGSLPINEAEIIKGFLNVAKSTSFEGRFQKLNDAPLTILDAAHNVAGVTNLMNELKQFDFEKLHIIYATSNDKNVQEIINILPKSARYYFAEFDSPRTFLKSEFDQLGNSNDLNYESFASAKQALNSTKKVASKNDLILIFGSFYMMSELI